jgi:hypothetical protein
MVKKLIYRILKKPREQNNAIRYANHINEFRKNDYRVFIANPYFSLDLEYEIEWNKKHIKKLREHKEKPHKFHSQFHDSHIDEHRKRHFREHVIDSIPFHEEIADRHKKRLDTILQIMPKKTYLKLVKISKKYLCTPEFFVYDKINKQFFFIADHIDEEKKKWICMVRDKYKICDVVEIRR